MIATALAFVLFAQQSGNSVLAVYPDDPTSWTLDYPVRIEPYVGEYYDCLRGGSYFIGDKATFESQYQKDIPRCAKKAVTLEAEANAALAASGGADATPPDEVAMVFERARRIHVARGGSLDLAIRTRLSTLPQYARVRETAADGLDDQGCVARLNTLVDQRAAYMKAEELRIEALMAQEKYTSEDQQTLARYQAQLQRYNDLVAIEQRGCAAARQRELAEFDQTQGSTEAHAQD